VGLILDTSLMIWAERKGLTVIETLGHWADLLGDTAPGLSVATLAEVAHGIPRALDERRRAGRVRFIEGLRSAIPIYPVDVEIAVRAGVIDGELRGVGITIGLGDALIASTALIHGDGVATHNVRHFRMTPGLRMIEV